MENIEIIVDPLKAAVKQIKKFASIATIFKMDEKLIIQAIN